MKQQYLIITLLCLVLVISSCAANAGQATKQGSAKEDLRQQEVSAETKGATQDLDLSDELIDQVDQLPRSKTMDSAYLGRSNGFLGDLLDLIKRQDDVDTVSEQDEIEFQAPPEGECAETDGGLNVGQAGITGGLYGAIGYREVEDYCLAGTRSGELAEFYCAAGGRVQQHVETCASGICENGACLILDEDSSETPETDSMEGDDDDRAVPPGYCSDSDGGQDLFTQGTARGDYGAIGYREMTDYCRDGTYSGSLVEYSCNAGRVEQRTFECPGECVEGACLSS